MSALILPVLDGLRSGVGYLAGGPLVDIARRSVLSVLQRIQIGQLVIEEDTTTIIGSQNLAVGAPPAAVTTLKIKSKAFWIRAALFADMVRLSKPT